MDAWFEIKKKDVIALLERRKDRSPWYIAPDEKYRCLVFWEDGIVRMTVNEFYEIDPDTYECCRFYTGKIGTTVEDFETMTEDQFVSAAYNFWCDGAR